MHDIAGHLFGYALEDDLNRETIMTINRLLQLQLRRCRCEREQFCSEAESRRNYNYYLCYYHFFIRPIHDPTVLSDCVTSFDIPSRIKFIIIHYYIYYSVDRLPYQRRARKRATLPTSGPMHGITNFNGSIIFSQPTMVLNQSPYTYLKNSMIL